MSEASNKKALKASFFYVICSFLVKGVGFITTPFFSRILTQEEYGYISNFNSWLSIITIIASLSLIASLIRARFDFENDYYSYISSILVLGFSFTVFCFFVIFGRLSFFESLFSLDKKYIILMGLTVLAQPAYEIFLQNQRFVYKYKLVSIMTVTMTLCSVVLSFVFIYLFEDNAWGKTLGGHLPMIIVSFGIYIYYFVRSIKINLRYCKYALLISLPYIFHLLSSVILGSSDRAMITHFCGLQANAVYSMAYNIGMIVNVIWMAFNQAFAPWLGERLHEKDHKLIKQVSVYYLLIFSFIVVGMLLFSPEALLILGGERYHDSLKLIPPVMMAYVIVFVDSLYVNILQFEKKTFGMACATVSSAMANLILNYIFIPRYGYAAAAYTTVAGYCVLLIIDYFLVRKIRLDNVYNSRYVLLSITGLIVFSFLTLFLYRYNVTRYVCMIIYIVVFGRLIWKYREIILNVFRK